MRPPFVVQVLKLTVNTATPQSIQQDSVDIIKLISVEIIVTIHHLFQQVWGQTNKVKTNQFNVILKKIHIII